jgi:nucleotide-binding universal stress UspA family protein
MKVQTILHPTDHSDSSRAALRYAVALAHDYGARLVILHVVKTLTPESVPPLETDSGGASRPLGRVPIEYVLRQGETVATILQTARERACDLIVLGHHPSRSWARLFGPGRAERILRDAPCPVLVVKDSMTPPAPPRDVSSEGTGLPPALPTEVAPRAAGAAPERLGSSVSA